MLWLLLIPLVYLAILALIIWSSMRPPRTPLFISPGAIGAPQEEVEFLSLDGTKLRAWWVEPAEAKSVIVFAHGYVMNRSEMAPLAVKLAAHGCASLLLDSRSHGLSEGRPCTLGVKERFDVIAAARFARDWLPGKPVCLFGSSMGAAACAFALAEDPGLAQALVLDGSYSRLSGAILGWWYFLGGKALRVVLSPTVILAPLVARLNPFAVDVARALPSIEVPVLFLHGDRDTLVSPSAATRNHAVCKDGGEIVWFEGCGHCEGRWIFPERYEEAVLAFLRRSGVVG